METYNGWTNWDTWNVALHVSTNQELYTYFCEFADEIRACRFDYPVQAMGARFTCWKLRRSSCFGSLWRVNWKEIADSYIDN